MVTALGYQVVELVAVDGGSEVWNAMPTILTRQVHHVSDKQGGRLRPGYDDGAPPDEVSHTRRQARTRGPPKLSRREPTLPTTGLSAVRQSCRLVRPKYPLWGHLNPGPASFLDQCCHRARLGPRGLRHMDAPAQECTGPTSKRPTRRRSRRTSWVPPAVTIPSCDTVPFVFDRCRGGTA